MNINPTYSLIQDLIATRDFKDSGLQLKGAKTSKEETPYFMLKVSSPRPKGFDEHHVTVFQELNRDTGGFSHYSMRSAEKTVRIFFDRFGTFFNASAKTASGEEISLTEEQQKQFRIIAQTTGAHVVNQLFDLTQQRFDKEHVKAEQTVIALEHWSKKHSIKKPKAFQEKLAKCARLFKKAALFCPFSKKQRQTLYGKARALQSCTTKLAEKKSKSPLKKPVETSPSSSIEAEASEEFFSRDRKSSETLPPTRDLPTINKDIAKIKQMPHSIEKICQLYRLLEEKLNALKGENFHTTIECFQQLEKIQAKAKKHIHACLKKNDLTGFGQLLAIDCEPDPKTLTLLVARGKADLFKKTYNKDKFSLGGKSRNFLAFNNFEKDFEQTNQTRKDIDQSGSGQFLFTALKHDQFDMFQVLLELGCNTNLRHQGVSLLQWSITNNGLKKDTSRYTKALLDFGANPHEELFEQRWRVVAGPGVELKKLKQTDYQKFVPRDLKTVPTAGLSPSPFMEAVRQGDNSLIAQMLASPHPIPFDKRLKEGFTALGIATCTQNEKMNRALVLMLLKAGFFVDQWQHPQIKGKVYKMTPLFFACQQGNVENAQFLVTKGASADEGHIRPIETEKTTKPYVSTPFQAAVIREHIAIVGYLLEERKVSASTVSLTLNTLYTEPTRSTPQPQQAEQLITLCGLIKVLGCEDLIQEKSKSRYETVLTQVDIGKTKEGETVIQRKSLK